MVKRILNHCLAAGLVLLVGATVSARVICGGVMDIEQARSEHPTSYCHSSPGEQRNTPGQNGAGLCHTVGEYLPSQELSSDQMIALALVNEILPLTILPRLVPPALPSSLRPSSDPGPWFALSAHISTTVLRT